MSHSKASRRRKNRRHQGEHKTLPKFTWRDVARALKRAGAWLSMTGHSIQIWILGGRYFDIPTNNMGRRAPNAFCENVFAFIAQLTKKEKFHHDGFVGNLRWNI